MGYSTTEPTELTSRAMERRSSSFIEHSMPTSYDEKDNMALLQDKLKQRKKPIYAGLAFLCIVVIGVSVAIASGGSTKANTSAGQTYPTPPANPPPPQQQQAQAPSQEQHPPQTQQELGEDATSSTSAEKTSGSSRGSGSPPSIVSSAETAKNESATLPTPGPTPNGPLLPWRAVPFDWTDTSNWEYASGRPVPADMFAGGAIKLTPANSAEPIRTKKGWGGEKIVLVEWERSESSDTNIWMLNTKLQSQFGKDNGWPYWGELDIFEMFTQDRKDKGTFDFSGFGPFTAVESYGQLTLHNGPKWGTGDPCFCPSSPAKSQWFQNSAPMTSGCTAQFANTPKNAIATVWGRDGKGQFLQLYQTPTITKGGKIGDVQTYDVLPGGTTTTKIYNNQELFWGTPSSAPCAKGGGHNPTTGFPFFEDFRLVLEEQKKRGWKCMV